MQLSLNALRAANQARIPQFKNKHGQPAHSREDGSDWNPAQWLQALVGEIGEFAEARLAAEVGSTRFYEYAVDAAKELADAQTYLDILAARALDVVPQIGTAEQADAAQRFMVVMSNLGQYANLRKKLDRGDVGLEEFEGRAPHMLNAAIHAITQLMVNGSASPVTSTHPLGVNLGQATVDKFNEVSKRVDSTIRLFDNGGLYEPFELLRVDDVVAYGAGGDTMQIKRVIEDAEDGPAYSGINQRGEFVTAPDYVCTLVGSGAKPILTA